MRLLTTEPQGRKLSFYFNSVLGFPSFQMGGRDVLLLLTWIPACLCPDHGVFVKITDPSHHQPLPPSSWGDVEGPHSLPAHLGCSCPELSPSCAPSTVPCPRGTEGTCKMSEGLASRILLMNQPLRCISDFRKCIRWEDLERSHPFIEQTILASSPSSTRAPHQHCRAGEIEVGRMQPPTFKLSV